jgi:hypothetical protein
MTPVVGDWNADGVDTPGLFQAPCNWFLRNSNSGGSHDVSFCFGASEMTPMAGDWNADGVDSAGLVH